MRGLQERGIIRRNKMLHAAIALFLEHGYEKTTTAQIARQAGMSPASFFAAFENKEALLLALTKIMFSGQFQKAEGMLAEVKNPLLLYGLETALQLHITEQSEPLRELYVTAYTLPTTSDFLYRSMLGRLCEIFQPYLPQAHENDFFELEIASASVTRGFMARKCDMYFTMERKLRRFLSCCYRLYEVPAAEYAPVIEQIVQADLRSAAEKIIASTVRQAELGFEGELARNTAREAQ